MKVPPGFQVELWAEGFQLPRYLMAGPNGDIFLADSKAKARPTAAGGADPADQGGAVYVFPKGDRAGKKLLLKGLDRPFAMALWKNYLYVAEAESVKRFPYDAANETAGEGQEVVSLSGFNKGHWTRGLLFDKDGSKMYVSVGSGSNVDTGDDPRRAAINRYNPDGTGHEIYASGVRNPVDIHWYPGSNRLWATVQERDGLGDDLVPDYLTQVKQGAFYGWPYAYTGPNEEPRHKGEKPELVAKTIAGDVQLGSHVAVLGFTFYTGKQFPKEYQNGAFLAYHGSGNRSQRVGQSVAFLPFKNGKPVGEPRAFLTGWMLSPDKKEVWGRPVGICQMADGSLLVSDDGGKKIWHVTYSK